MKEIFLRPWQEAIGKVTKVEVNPEVAVLNLSFKIDEAKIEIPINELRSDIRNLKELKGQMVAILRTEKCFIVKETRASEGEVYVH